MTKLEVLIELMLNELHNAGFKDQRQVNVAWDYILMARTIIQELEKE